MFQMVLEPSDYTYLWPPVPVWFVTNFIWKINTVDIPIYTHKFANESDVAMKIENAPRDFVL